jgi:hypothetical protein
VEAHASAPRVDGSLLHRELWQGRRIDAQALCHALAQGGVVIGLVETEVQFQLIKGHRRHGGEM